ncbi:translation initiation factor IF-2 subunit beta [Haloferax mediterranei ATCC 33500]|uniref:Translation initiation factor 2 subunit beta n=1 Tax=Haloferax mediterranei (strain ATCC 33500 / DSM 1411 / JCM 8866 / NBRC 14739 / NCIMB 2177 / R-4) TaxID=523841 RepID=I3R5G5_HALMT|nr:translation initiation factor IF-2 subunit beta [Haloferax mediterranei]AFK19475.1 translation initiation factor IF-2 subunit beta [Haloferax mediterranei ATCC 33500]AHZ21180.1 translation initiation factor IF-2 subunit beta [Haloferax mediterranei ATCC 33500]EMA04337.1 translation initiation factor IF-2 subunit beta [Haloferax mediterranei ATCC 33500]MDX5989578.1 translation initiation factor IF-2 subunit beta [Haloferax mediterranei ATCC 33500]QCQ75936.1 translation initiation factor IF-2
MDYDEQLDRALSETPDVAESGDRFTVPDPTVRQEGNVTVYENFAETYDRLARDADHVVKFFQSELGTSAQIDDKGRARFTGEFRQRRIAEALEDYVESFVLCSECGSPDTRIVTEQGADVLKCDACGALSAIPDI